MTSQHSAPGLPSAKDIAALPPDGGDEFNRLIFEKSPYLLQHARNPVDWYPWGEEALARAREEDRPIFLSVGYSTCHWCHVMEHESFEDEGIAALMNKAFVCIKVDREERPDLDHVYMTVTQAMTGSGGWPMTVIMAPDGKPFYAGTYFPKTGRSGRIGMQELVPMLERAWKENRAQLLSSAEKMTQYLIDNSRIAPGRMLEKESVLGAFGQLAQRFDEVHGGFGESPKFPIPHNLNLLLQVHARTGDVRALRMVETTLRAMRRGGIFDHVGFGFHRYSTDRVWLLPHFEKMLYDQALLGMAYVGAWQATGDDFYRRTANEIFTYVERDMTSPEGGFYSAEDADSEGEEGLFYVWTPDEVRAVLGQEEGDLYCRVQSIVEGGNFRDQTTGQLTGSSIPHLAKPLSAIAGELGIPTPDLQSRLEASRRALFAVREGRIHPLKDDKILTDWNGLMIASLARAASAFNEPRYAEAASRAADFILTHLRDERGRLLKRYRLGESAFPATLEDHAFMAWGLVELYQATFEERWLREAIAILDEMEAHFLDGKNGGFFLSADDGEKLIVRPKEIYDGAIPSGNSVAALALLEVARITGKTRYEELADGIFRAFSNQVLRAPSAHAMLMQAVDFAAGPSFEVVVAGDPEAEDTRAMLARLRSIYAPTKVLVLRPDTGGEEKSPPSIAGLAPFTAAQRARDGKATAYLCRNFACEAPTHDVDAVARSLMNARYSPAPADEAGSGAPADTDSGGQDL